MSTTSDNADRDDPCAAGCRARPCPIRLARYVAHVFLRYLLRSRPHGLPCLAGHQRRPRAAGPGFRHARPPGHGDRHLRPGRCLGAPGQHGQRLDHPRPASSSACRRGPACGTASSIRPRREPVHLYQIWLLPDQKGLTPSYEQRTFSEDEKQGGCGWSPRPMPRMDRS